MNINIKSKLDARCLHNKKTLSIVSLLFMMAIISSPLISVYSGVSPFALGAEPNVTGVSSESALVAAIAAAPDEVSYIIEIKSIELEDTLQIPAGKNITLVNFGAGSGSLYGANDKTTIVVMPGGQLVLDGIVVSHTKDARGIGVNVTEGGKLTMVAGRIIDNVASDGAGVYNKGNFTMAGGVISNNNASNGGGVYNVGNFNMTGGAMHSNRASSNGGAIYSRSETFRMTGGDIYTNVATRDGGGIYTAVDFVMSGGQIYRNSASDGGGGVYNDDTFLLSGNGMIYNNTATDGGGVYTAREIFKMTGGVISNNTVSGSGGGIYIRSGSIDLNGASDNRCIIANNTARYGGGIGIYSTTYYENIWIQRFATFSNNKAASAYSRTIDDDKLYNDHIDYRVTWTSPFTQGYNNYDIQYTRGTQVDPSATPSPSPTPTPTPTPSTPTPTYTVRPTNTPPPTTDSDIWLKILIVVVIVVGLVLALLMFYLLPKRQEKQAAPDWIDSTPTA